MTESENATLPENQSGEIEMAELICDWCGNVHGAGN